MSIANLKFIVEAMEISYLVGAQWMLNDCFAPDDPLSPYTQCELEIARKEKSTSAVIEKAMCDDWQYKVVLVDGSTFTCQSMRQDGDWLHLIGIEEIEGDFPLLTNECGRGIDIHISKVIAVLDTDS